MDLVDLEQIAAKAEEWLEHKLQQNGEVKEYESIAELRKQKLFDALGEVGGNLRLFRDHFVMRHAAFALRKRWIEKGLLIDIDALGFRQRQLHPLEFETAEQSLSEVSGVSHLAEFYLNWQHLLDANEESVNHLLANFWRLYDKQQNFDDCYEALGVEADASWEEVKKAYRRCVQTHHPDKGGDGTKFVKIQEAYELLKIQISQL